MTRWERRRRLHRQGAVKSTLGIALAVLVAACGAPPSLPPSPATGIQPAGPTRICEGGPDGEHPPISCTEVIGKVLLAMGPDAASVQAAWFRPGAPCPPNARCIAPAPGSAYVVVRLESGVKGIFPVTFAGNEVAIGAVTEPTFDIWPPSGEAIPPVGEVDVGPAPAEISGRSPLPRCDAFIGHRIGRCFLGAVLDGRPAEFVTKSVDEAGDPIIELYRYIGRGPVLVYQTPAGPGWLRGDCAIGPGFDGATTFVVAECVSTQLL